MDQPISFSSVSETGSRCGDSVDNTVNSNALATVSKDVRAVKLCANKILQFLTECVS